MFQPFSLQFDSMRVYVCIEEITLFKCCMLTSEGGVPQGESASTSGKCRPSMISFEPLVGGSGSLPGTPAAYLLSVDQVNILLDCGAPDWASSDSSAYIDALSKSVSHAFALTVTKSNCLNTQDCPLDRSCPPLPW
jgi:hypothetical protein